MGYRLGASSRANLKGLHPSMKRVVERAIEITTQDFTVYAGGRTAAEQNALYQKGRTRPGAKVTSKDGYKNKSNHQARSDGFYGAVDLVPWHNSKPTWDWDLIWPIASAMSKAAKELGVVIKWGGNWYETMDKYGDSVADMKASVERYKRDHPGPDFIDGPHYELAQ